MTVASRVCGGRSSSRMPMPVASMTRRQRVSGKEHDRHVRYKTLGHVGFCSVHIVGFVRCDAAVAGSFHALRIIRVGARSRCRELLQMLCPFVADPISEAPRGSRPVKTRLLSGSSLNGQSIRFRAGSARALTLCKNCRASGQFDGHFCNCTDYRPLRVVLSEDFLPFRGCEIAVKAAAVRRIALTGGA
jgi:hypothetical protein